MKQKINFIKPKENKLESEFKKINLVILLC